MLNQAQRLHRPLLRATNDRGETIRGIQANHTMSGKVGWFITMQDTPGRIFVSADKAAVMNKENTR